MDYDFKTYCQIVSDQYAFTLIEVLFAIGILSIGMLGLMVLQMSGLKGNAVNMKATEAISIAQSHMENIINSDFSSPALADINGGNNRTLKSIVNFDYKNINADGSRGELPGYDVIYNVADNTPIKNTKTVSVAVVSKGGKVFGRLGCIKSQVSHSQSHLFER